MTYLVILFSHLVADTLQLERWSVRKNYSVKALYKHCITYSIILSFLLFPYLGNKVILFAILNCVMHSVVDGITSNVSNFFTKRGRMQAVIVTFLMDQLAHLTFVYSIFMLLRV